jgi:aspartyl-tRNA(Asn)/glutamyl-tRNA(Gln) amidotransferase subunit C
MISEKEVRHIAKLAKLELTESEVKKFSGELSDILDFFKVLQKVKTDKVEETAQVTGLLNVSRSDEIVVDGNETALLECTPHKIKNHSVQIPKIM